MTNPAFPYPWQENLWTRFCSQVQSGRIAHAFLFYGAPGLGKGDFATAAAALLLCENQDSTLKAHCGHCRSCTLLAAGNQPDLLIIEKEEGSRVLKIDQVRALGEFASKTAHSSRYKVVVIREADLLNVSAANAMLKTLEEPASNTVLMLTSSRPGALPATIRSRCQKLYFPMPDKDTALGWLASKVPGQNTRWLLDAANGSPLAALAMAGDGTMEVRSKLLRGLAAMWHGEMPLIDLVAVCREMEIRQTVTQLEQVSAILLKYLLTNNRELVSESGLGKLADKLCPDNPADKAIGKNNGSLKALLEINQLAEIAGRQLNGGSNPNPGLITQSLLWHWHLLGRCL